MMTAPIHLSRALGAAGTCDPAVGSNPMGRSGTPSPCTWPDHDNLKAMRVRTRALPILLALLVGTSGA